MSTDTNETTTPEQDKTQTTTTATDAITSGNSEEVTNQDSGKMVKMSQEAFDALISERVRRAKTAATSETLEMLEVDNLDQAKSVLAAHKEAQQAQMSELEKAQATNATLQASLAQKESDHTEVLQRNAIIMAAPNHEIPSDRMAALLKLMDMSALKTENGQVTGIDDAIKKVIEENPFILFVGSDDGKDKNRLTPSATNNKAMQEALKQAAKDGKRTRKLTSSI